MSVDYTIAAIPTVYRGRRYRSRLEARWAAFFDLLNWTAEYEPFDLGSWSPDFLLPPVDPRPGLIGGLVEVKPLIAFDRAVSERMLDAIEERGMGDSTWLMLLGTSPWLDHNSIVSIGWSAAPNSGFAHSDWEATPLIWVVDPHRPALAADVFQVWAGAKAPFMGARTFASRIGGTYSTYTMELWARATNAVQYHPGAQS